MKTSLLCLLLSLALLAGCTQAPKDERVNGSGQFTATNIVGTVFWGHLQDSTTNDLQFVLLLPETEHFGGGTQTRGDNTYDYCDIKIKRDGHQWKLEANGDMKTGVTSMQLTDLTANTVTNIDLSRGRLWQISDDKSLISLDKIDPAIMEKVLQDSESGYKDYQSLRKQN